MGRTVAGPGPAREERMEVSAEKVAPSGGWRVSAIVGGYLRSVLYLGYTKRDAVRAFRASVAK